MVNTTLKVDYPTANSTFLDLNPGAFFEIGGEQYIKLAPSRESQPRALHISTGNLVVVSLATFVRVAKYATITY